MSMRLLLAVLCVLAIEPAIAGARTVVLHDRTGLTARAPAGFRLSQQRGVYRISGRGVSLLYARLRSRGATPRRTGAELARTLGHRPSGVRSSGTAWTARVGGRTLEVRRRGRDLVVLSFSGTSHGARAAALRPGLDVLRRIAQSIRGGRRAALPQPIPMRRFTAPDGGSSALVPDLPGWTYNGGSGIIEGIGPQGAFAFGYPFLAAVPGSSAAGQVTTAPFPATAADGLRIVVALEFRRLGLALTDVDVRTRFDGSQTLLGSQYRSDFMTARARGTGGIAVDGVFLYGAGLFDTGVDGEYANYLSYALVRRGTDPRIGAALLRAWGSWNPSADQQRRTAAATHAILTTAVGGGAIDPQVFDEAAAKWDAYFRGDGF